MPASGGGTRFDASVRRTTTLDRCRNFSMNITASLPRSIMEPANFYPPAKGFLEGVKDLARRQGALLIFDEICSGFHFGSGGARRCSA